MGVEPAEVWVRRSSATSYRGVPPGARLPLDVEGLLEDRYGPLEVKILSGLDVLGDSWGVALVAALEGWPVQYVTGVLTHRGGELGVGVADGEDLKRAHGAVGLAPSAS
jgi:hypothetical protein